MKDKGLEEIVFLDLDKLQLYDKNGKSHSDEQIASIATQIKRFGFDQPIVVTDHYVILKGEGRTLASRKLKLKKVPCIVRTGLSESEQIAIRMADNKVAESPWNYDNLKFDFEKLKEFNFDFLFTGFPSTDIETILEGWKTDLAKVDDTEEHTEGIFSVIKVICPPEVKEDIRALLKETISSSRFSGVQVG